MLTEPLTITIDGTAISLPRVQEGNFSSEYWGPNQGHKLNITHSFNGGRETDRVRLDVQKNVVDPLDTTKTVPVQSSVQLIINRPAAGLGYTDVELQKVTRGLLAWLTDANVLALLQKQS